MAMYKVPQDVEAEDKFLGPLTFKQFLFGGGALVLGYVMFITLTTQKYVLSAIFFPFFAVFAMLAFPWSKDQPTELWLASRIRFMFIPRKRIWNQSGVKDLVQITVPKREVHVYTDGLSQDQVRSRLSALASVVDTRGWAVKNSLYARAAQTQADDSDRLVMKAPTIDENMAIVNSTVDVMDSNSNPIAHQFDDLIVVAEDKHRKQTMEIVEKARTHAHEAGQAKDFPINTAADLNSPQDSWIQATQSPLPQDMSALKATLPTQGVPTMGMGIATAQNSPTSAEEKVLEQVHRKQQKEQDILSHSHLRVVDPVYDSSGTSPLAMSDPAAATAQISDDNSQQQSASTTPVNPAILDLAHNDDLSVETLARQAQKGNLGDDEVIITLR